LSKGARRGAAAKAVGVSRQTILNHIKEDEKFHKAVDEAEMDANEVVEDALYKAACSGNIVAIQVWLYNRDPLHWTDKRNIQVNASGKIIHKVEVVSEKAKELTEKILKGENT